MVLYLKYLEDNLNNTYNKEIDEFRKYVKLFYDENSRCPVDLKVLLEKEEKGDEYNFRCKLKSGKIWSADVKKPVIVNLNVKLNEITDEYNNECIIFKNLLKKNLNSSIYSPDNDKDIEKQLINSKKKEEELDSLREIFEKEKDSIEEIIKKRQVILKNLLEIKIKKNNVYKKCPVLNSEIRKKLIEIAKNESNITATRLEQIAKNVELNTNDVKNWIEYYKFVMDYLKENDDLEKLNKDKLNLEQKYEKINSYFIVEPPKINISEGAKKEEKEMKEVKEIKEEKKDRKKDKEEKKNSRMRIKIKKAKK